MSDEQKEQLGKYHSNGTCTPRSAQDSYHCTCGLRALFEAAIVQAQTNAVAWTVGVIDEMHGRARIEADHVFKGIKNSIRDRYKGEIGIDPAPNYPVKAQLNQSLNKEASHD